MLQKRLNVERNEIEKAIHLVYKGQMYFGEGVSQTVFDDYVKGILTTSKEENDASLTKR